METGTHRMHWVDWLLFATMLMTSLAIGVYHSLTGDKQRSTAEYLLGSRKMPLIPVMVSATVSFVSTITTLGYPAEMFAFGTQYWMGSVAMVAGAIIAVTLYVPVLYPLQLTSVNEYFELRYGSKLVKYIALTSTILGSIIHMGNLFFGPSTAIEAVSGFPVWASIIVGSIVSIVYTSLGGFRAVVWTDFFQSIIMAVAVIAVVVQGTLKVGGFSKVWEINGEWDRIRFFDFDPDPTKRLNFWGATFGMGLMWASTYGHQQVGYQRYASLPSLRKATHCVFGVIPGSIALAGLSCLSGVVIFAYYTRLGCDPVKAGYISNYNQVLPYFVIDVFKLPGVSGIFLSSVFAASLSSISSILNACAANIWADVIKPLYPDMKEINAVFINKMIVVFMGIVGIAVAFIISVMGGTMLQIAFTMGNAIGSPLGSLIMIGIFIPWVNWKGATFGSLFGFAFGLWLGIGSYFTDKNWTPLPSPTTNCTYLGLPVYNMSVLAMDTLMTTSAPVLTTAVAAAVPVTKHLSGIQKFYSVSFVWHREISQGVTIIVALLVSAITGFRNPSTIDARLMHPLVSNYLKLKVFDTNIKAKDGSNTEKMGLEHGIKPVPDQTLQETTSVTTL